MQNMPYPDYEKIAVEDGHVFESVAAFLENCKRLQARESEFDFIMPNHNGCPVAKEYLTDFITAAQHVVDGKPDLVPFAHLPGFMHPFDGDIAVRVRVGNSCINYLPEGVKSRMKF